MHGFRSFLMIGDTSAIDLISLVKNSPEVVDCNFSFDQAVNEKGRVATRVYSGALQVNLSQLPPQDILVWALNSRKYTNGAIVMLNAENIPLEKIFFEYATCIRMEISYTQKGQSYASTKLIIQAQKLIVGDGIDFENKWTI